MSGSSENQTFNKAAGDTSRPEKNKLPAPFSIRFTHNERKQLNRDAGRMALSAYIRLKLFGDAAKPRKPQYTRKSRQPKPNYVELAKVLGQLGQSELATSMLVLALAAKSGALPVTLEISDKLDKACTDINEMNIALITSLGIKAQ